MKLPTLTLVFASFAFLPVAPAQKPNSAFWDGYLPVAIEVSPFVAGDTRPIMDSTVTLTLDPHITTTSPNAGITRGPFAPLKAPRNAAGVTIFRVAFPAGGEAHLDEPSRDTAHVRIGDSFVRCEARGYAPVEVRVVPSG